MSGRVSHISKTYTKLNNKHFKPYEPKQELKHIIYLDTNIFFWLFNAKFLFNKWI